MSMSPYVYNEDKYKAELNKTNKHDFLYFGSF